MKKTPIAIVGCGNIGKELVRLLKPFECRVWIRDILKMSEFCKENDTLEKSFDEVLNGADIIRAHDVGPTVDALKVAEAVMVVNKR